jgi:hypothetical protein
MFPKYRHTPIFDAERKRCSVCHQAVYSLAGIHPQCAIKRADALELKSKSEAASEAGSTLAIVVLRTDDAFRKEARPVKSVQDDRLTAGTALRSRGTDDNQL